MKYGQKPKQMRCEMELSEDLKKFRTDRPDEWTIDRWIRKATDLEAQVAFQKKVIDEVRKRLPISVSAVEEKAKEEA